MRRLLQPLLAEHAPGEVTQALMDLGATICRPRTPLCLACPLREECAAFSSGTPEAFPARKAKASRPRRHGFAYWTERAGSVWLVRRDAKGLLGGMAALPVSEWSDTPTPTKDRVLGTVRHTFTHFALDLTVIGAAEPVGDGWWQPLEGLSEAGLPTLFRRAADVALGAPAPPLEVVASRP